MIALFHSITIFAAIFTFFPSFIPPQIPELTNLVELDLSSNFLDSVPVQALKSLGNLKFLNLGSNKIRVRACIK